MMMSCTFVAMIYATRINLQCDNALFRRMSNKVFPELSKLLISINPFNKRSKQVHNS